MIRKPENIRTLHETFKRYGYGKIFTHGDLTSNPCIDLSAYNPLYEAHAYANFNWDREKLKANLNRDTTHCCPSPLIPDNTK